METEGALALEADLPLGHVAYVDSDWVPDRPFPALPALVIGDGKIRRAAGPSVPVPEGADPDTTAALSLLAVSRAAAAACGQTPPGSVVVEGAGLIASAIQMLLHDKGLTEARGADDVRPVVIVECTGSPRAIVDATRRLPDGGTLVLAGERLGRPLDVDLYTDVHSRCLRIIGVPRPLDDATCELDPTGLGEAWLDMFRRTLAGVSSGVALPSGAAWYRLAG